MTMESALTGPPPLLTFSPPLGQLVGEVALAVGWGPSPSLWAKFAVSLASLAKAAPAATVVLFSNVDARALMGIPQYMLPPRLLVLNFSLPSLQAAWGFDARPLELADSGWWRFPLFASFVRSHCLDAERLLWFDLKDLLFIRSPFELLPTAVASSILTTTETGSIVYHRASSPSW